MLKDIRFVHKAPLCRVIGYGPEAIPAIDRIKGIAYDGLEAVAANDADRIEPAGERMCILLVAGDGRQAQSVAKDFCRTGALTLLISDAPRDWGTDDVDAMMAAGPDKWADAVKILLEPVFSAKGFVNYDFSDFARTLRSGHRFDVVEVVGETGESVAEMLSKIIPEGCEHNVEYASFILYFNKNTSAKTCADHARSLTDCLSRRLQSSGTVWAAFYDDGIDVGAVRLTAIVAGKNLASCSK